MDLEQFGNAMAVFTAAIKEKDLPLHHVQILVFIAIHRSVTYQQLMNYFSLSNAAISRSVNALSGQAKHRASSHDLVEIYRDPAEGRRYKVKLSNKGLELFDLIESV